MRHLFTLLFMLLGMGAQVAEAQDLDSLRVGARVRVWAAPAGLEGRIGEITAIQSDRLLLRLARSDTMSTRLREVPLSAIDRLDLSRGRESWSGPATRGGLIGLGAGLALAVLTATNCPSDGTSCYVVEFTAPPLGVVLGALIGATGRRDVWQTVTVRR